MSETTLPPASRYQDGSQKTVIIDGVSVTYQVMGGEWVKISETDIRTIVVPAGESFRIVDDADNPAIVAVFSNRSSSIPIGDGAAAFYVSTNTSGNGAYANFLAYGITDPLDQNFGDAAFLCSVGNGSGNTDFSVSVAADGSSSFYTSAETIEIPNRPTYADNTAALAGGLTAGMEYKTAAGDLKTVV